MTTRWSIENCNVDVHSTMQHSGGLQLWFRDTGYNSTNTAILGLLYPVLLAAECYHHQVFSVHTSYIMLRGHFYRSRLTVAPSLTIITLCLLLSVSRCPSLLLFLMNNGTSLVHMCLLSWPNQPYLSNPKPTRMTSKGSVCRTKVIGNVLARTPNRH